MKYLILILISFSAFGENWMPHSKILEGSIAGHQLKSSCENISGEQCFDVGDETEAVEKGFFSLTNELVDDLNSPIWGSRSLIETCLDEENCKSIHSLKQCYNGDQSYYSVEDLEVWCNKITGYNKKESGKKIFEIDQVALSNYHLAKSAQAQVNDLISRGSKARSDCQKVLDLVGGFNLLPGRTTDQAGEMVSTFAQAKQHLQDGRPAAAKAAIIAIPVDGVLVTQSIKDLALDILKDW